MISETSSSVTSNPALSAGGCLAHHGLRQTGTRDTEMDPKLNTLSRHSSLGEMDAGACSAEKLANKKEPCHWPVSLQPEPSTRRMSGRFRLTIVLIHPGL